MLGKIRRNVNMWYYPGEKRSKEFNADTMLLKEEYEATAMPQPTENGEMRFMVEIKNVDKILLKNRTK